MDSDNNKFDPPKSEEQPTTEETAPETEETTALSGETTPEPVENDAAVTGPDETGTEESTSAPVETEPEAALAGKDTPEVDQEDGDGAAPGETDTLTQAPDNETESTGYKITDDSGDPLAEEVPEDDDKDPDAVRTVGVIIKGQNRSSHFNAGEHSLKPGDEVVIQTEKGKAVGVVTEAPMQLACRGCENRKILRKASPGEIEKDTENRVKEKEAFSFCSATIEDWDLPMRLVKVEFLLDRSKAIFYFTAEKRVDFRELVRTLAKEFSTRIEMRQIGIRDEAKLVGGIGPCGMAFCCSTFLSEFAPISVKMAKEQNVILNPNKISGGCGRLLCCLNYEYEQYRDVSRGLPKIGKKVTLPDGAGRVRSIDIFTNTITIDMPENKTVTLDIEEFREKIK